MKQSVIRELTDAEVHEKLAEETNNYTKLRTGHSVSPIENPLKIRKSRRTIARLLTEQKKRTNKSENK